MEGCCLKLLKEQSWPPENGRIFANVQSITDQQRDQSLPESYRNGIKPTCLASYFFIVGDLYFLDKDQLFVVLSARTFVVPGWVQSVTVKT